MKKLLFAFLTLLLGGSLAWGVTISGTITVKGTDAQKTALKSLYVMVGNEFDFGSKNILDVSNSTYSVNLNTGTVIFAVCTNDEPGFLFGDKSIISKDWVFVSGSQEVNPLEITDGSTTVNLVIAPVGSGGGGGGEEPDPTPTTTLVGSVLSGGTGVPKVTVSITGQGDNTFSKTTETAQSGWNDALDKNIPGYYELKEVPYGSYTVSYAKEGYKTVSRSVTVGEADGNPVELSTVTLEAQPMEYIFEGYIKYVDASYMTVYVEGAKITAYDGSGAGASVVGTPVYTDKNGYWSMTVECTENTTLYFFAEHPNIDVTNRKEGTAIYRSGNNVEISCEEHTPDLLGMETYKVKQSGTKDYPLVDISWTWPEELIEDYKTAENVGIFLISRIIIYRQPYSGGNVKTIATITPEAYTLPSAYISFTDGTNEDDKLVIGSKYKYSMSVEYSSPTIGKVDIPNDNALTIELTDALAKPDSVTLTLESDHPDWGTVTGGGKCEKNDMVVIKAKANKGYLFKGWRKGNTIVSSDAETKVIVTEDMTLTAVFEERPPFEDYVTVTLVADAVMGTVDGTGQYGKGEEVTIKAIPNAGYVFKQWKAGNVILSTKPTYTFIANTDSTITAVFEREIVYRGMINCRARQVADKKIRLDWEWPQELIDGYVKPDGTGFYKISIITIGRKNAATPLASSVNVATIRPVDDYTLPPTYCEDEGTYELDEEGKQQLKPLEDGATYIYYLVVQYEKPANKAVEINADEKDPRLTVTLVENPVPVQFYTLSIIVNDDEGIVSGAGSSYMEGDKVMVTATAKPGYVFKRWKDQAGNELSTANKYQVTITGNTVLIAEFAEEAVTQTVTLEVSANDQTKGTVSGDRGSFAEGTQVTVVATPATGYVFDSWQKENGEVVNREARYTFTLTENLTLVAVFVEKPTGGDEIEYVTIIVGTNNPAMGTVTCSGSNSETDNDKYIKGTQVTVTAIANEGCIFKGWQENGQMLNTTTATYKFFAEADRTLTAVFSDSVSVKLQINNPSMGTVTGEGKYKIGTEVPVTATPNDGYVFQSWMAGLTEVATTAEYKLTVVSDTTLMAVFAPKPAAEMVKLTINVDEKMGTVTGAGTGEYEKGTSVTVTAIPNEGYVFKAWKEDGKEVFTEAEYTFVIEADRTLEAVFVAQTVAEIVTLTINVDETMGSVFGAGKYKKGVNAKVTAIPNEGYVFKAWKEDGEEVSTEAEYTFVIEADRTLEAVFVEKEANEDVELAAWNVFAENGRIVLHSNTDCRYEVYTLGGILVKQGEMRTNVCRIAVGNSGLYIVRRISSTGISVRKVVVR